MEARKIPEKFCTLKILAIIPHRDIPRTLYISDPFALFDLPVAK